MTLTPTKFPLMTLADSGAKLGEGPSWDHRTDTLYWLDITSGTLHLHDWKTRTNRQFKVLEEMIGCLFLTQTPGVVVLAAESGFYRFDTRTETCTHLADPIPAGGTHRFNDGKADPLGHIYIGTMATRGGGEGKFYRVDKGFTATVIGDPLVCPNGVDWSLDGRTLYHCDTVNKCINTYLYNSANGEAGEKTGSIDLSHVDGSPDGFAIDGRGLLWVGFWGGSAVHCIDPTDRSVIDTIPMPVPLVTSVAFGGDDLLDLFITTANSASMGQSTESGPAGGELYHTRVAHPGRLENLLTLS